MVKVHTPRTRDFVRVCKCGERIVCTIVKHGHIDILTVEYNGYLFHVGYYHPTYYTDKGYRVSSQALFYESCFNSLLLEEQTGINRYELQDWINKKGMKKLMRDKIFKKLTEEEREIIRASNLSPYYDRPLYLIRSLRPKKITYVHCTNCASKVMFKTFKELKHGGS